MALPHLVRRLGFSYLRGRKVSQLHLLVLAASDWFLLIALGREKPAPAPSLEGKRMVIAKIDHLGDVLMITPLLRELRDQAPSCRVELMLGSWCRELGEMLLEAGLCTGFFFYDSPSLSKGPQSFLKKLLRGYATFNEATRHLRGADIFIDLRPFSPNAVLAARLAGVPHKIGFGLRGCSFFLQQELAYAPDRSLGDLFLGALDLLGLKRAVYQKPCLTRPDILRERVDGISLPARFVAVHPFSLDQARMTRHELWAGLISRLAESLPVVVVGTRKDGDSTLAGMIKQTDGVIPLMGRTTFREAVETMAAAKGFVGVDSVFSHVALAFDLPTLVLLTQGAGHRASFPVDNPQLHFIDPDAPETNPGTILELFFRLADRA